MRDPGIAAAIEAAGGVGALARKIGIAQPSVSNWIRVPAERVIAVEAVTGVHRSVLRPDLYGVPADPSIIAPAEIDELDVARSRQYALLAVLLARAPDAEVLARIATLRGDASPLGLAQAPLAPPSLPAPLFSSPRFPPGRPPAAGAPPTGPPGPGPHREPPRAGRSCGG